MSSPKVIGYSFDSGRHFSEPHEVESPGMRAARQCAEHEASVIEATLARWCEQTGLSPAELGKLVGYTVERARPEPAPNVLIGEAGWLRFGVRVRPIALGRDGESVAEKCS